MRDEALVARLLAREPGAWEEFLLRYGGMIEATCRKALLHSGSSEPIQDAVAEVHRALLEYDARALRLFRPGGSLGSYLHVFARHRTIERIRKRTPMPWLRPVADEADPSVLLAAAERREGVRLALGRLPAREAELLRLFHLEELAYRDIAERTGIPEAQVGVVLLRARESLRKEIGGIL